MNKTLSDIATEMSNEATRFFESKIEIPQSAIVKLPIWDNYTDVDMYACKYQYFIIIACIESIENNTVVEVKIVG